MTYLVCDVQRSLETKISLNVTTGTCFGTHAVEISATWEIGIKNVDNNNELVGVLIRPALFKG